MVLTRLPLIRLREIRRDDGEVAVLRGADDMNRSPHIASSQNKAAMLACVLRVVLDRSGANEYSSQAKITMAVKYVLREFLHDHSHRQAKYYWC